MLEVLRFIFRYREEIILIIYSLIMIVIAFISLIVLICKKLKATDNDLVYVLADIPNWIKEAESLLSVGKEKYTYVYSKAISMLTSLKKLSEADVVKKYSFIIDKSIESILSTPTKKEVNYAKDNENEKG